MLVQAAVVEPIDPFQGGYLDLLDGPRGLINSVLYSPLMVSARALMLL